MLPKQYNAMRAMEKSIGNWLKGMVRILLIAIYLLILPIVDDLRQDAVLASIFEIANLLFRKERSKSDSVYIRTYKIVPLAARCGVLEWVESTTPLGKLLSDAHRRQV
jgi:phosphatidylinositol kinase/protein kinase (PI-3  family)